MTQDECERLSREKWIILEELRKLYEWWFLRFLSHRHVVAVAKFTEQTVVNDLGLTYVTDKLGKLCGPLSEEITIVSHKTDEDFKKDDADKKKKQKEGLSR